MTRDEIIELAIQGHANTRDAIRWAMAQECEQIHNIAMKTPLNKDLLMDEKEWSDEREKDEDTFFNSEEFRYTLNNTVKATTFVIMLAIKARNET